jgi:hypothetical protein
MIYGISEVEVIAERGPDEFSYEASQNFCLISSSNSV